MRRKPSLPTPDLEATAATVLIAVADHAFTDAFTLITMARGVEPTNPDWRPGSAYDAVQMLVGWREEPGRVTACAVALATMVGVLAEKLAYKEGMDPVEWLRATALRHQANLG